MKRNYNDRQQPNSDERTYAAIVAEAAAFLEQAGREREIALNYLLDTQEWSFTDWIQHQRTEMPASERAAYREAIRTIVREVLPYQYATGQAWFYHYPFHVTPATLIPRQETEQLVDLVLKAIQTGRLAPTARVWDIGTGSGAIAVTLKRECDTLSVVASDVSAEALRVAKQNAHTLGSGNIDFRLGDLFAPVKGEQFDVIVTNPPYIAESERPYMGEDVLKHEPHSALFASQEGYAFYWRILAELAHYLAPGGYFLCECGFRQGATLKARFASAFPTWRVRLIDDYAGIPRVLVVER